MGTSVRSRAIFPETKILVPLIPLYLDLGYEDMSETFSSTSCKGENPVLEEVTCLKTHTSRCRKEIQCQAIVFNSVLFPMKHHIFTRLRLNLHSFIGLAKSP